LHRPALLNWFADLLGEPPRRVAGGDLLRPQPHVGPFAYMARLYDPLAAGDLNGWLSGANCSRNDYTRFLETAANGLRFVSLNLYGVIHSIDRSVGPGAGQPISIDYGNLIERPAGMDEGQMVIGGAVGWSSRGVFIIDDQGRVRLTHHADAHDIAAEWDSLEAMLKAETTRIASLLDLTGAPLSTHTALMHPGGRRWETKAEPLTTVH